MENKWKYRSTIKSRPYFYIETKQLAKLVVKGLNDLEIKQIVLKDNLFQVKTEARKREIASTILKRLNVLDEYLLNQVITGDIETSKIIVLYAIVKTDRLFYEFMNEVFKEKFTYRDPVLIDNDFNVFFEAKRQQSSTVASWRDYTFYKLKQVYIRILSEAGLLTNKKGQRCIQPPLINPKVIEHIRSNDKLEFIQAVIGGDSM